jgi:glutathione S-transferase
MGERFTAADVILGHCGQWARGAKFEIASERVNAYFDRVLARPALTRAKEKEAAA